MNEAKEDKQRRGPIADSSEARQATHQECRDADQDQAELEQGFAANLVADVSEDHAPERARDKAHCIGREGGNDSIQSPGNDDTQNRRGVEAPGLRGVLMMWQLSVSSVAIDDPDVMERVGHERSLWLKSILGHVRELVGFRGEWQPKH